MNLIKNNIRTLQEHEPFMDLALKEACKSQARGEVPVGAVLVGSDGKILARAHNTIEHSQTQLAHAEIKVLRIAAKKTSSWRMDGCWLYVTLEPCVMCFGALSLSRVEGIVFGATSPLFGAGLLDPLTMEKVKSKIQIIGNLKQEASADILRQFFKRAREK